MYCKMDCSTSSVTSSCDNSALESSRSEFNKKCRRISIKNMPAGINNQDISVLLKPYHYQQIHIDKLSLSCKAVLLDGDSACRCIEDLNIKLFRGSQLIVSLASCDFMLCVTQLPEMYTKEQFLTLITPFGTPERCFLVHSEVTGESKGYGCVEFTSKESSIKAKNHLNGKAIGPYTLQVHWLDSIPQSYSGLHSCCLLIENLPSSHKDSKVLQDLFTHNNTRPIFCQSANCAEDDFSISEYSNSFDAEIIWMKMKSQKIGGSVIRLSFCVPGPCGLVILNSVRASQDLKRNHPSGGLLPTPVQKLDSLQYQLKSGVGSQGPLRLLGGALAHAASQNDPEVQRLLKALHVRLSNVPDANCLQQQFLNMKGISHGQIMQPSRQFFGDGRFLGHGFDMPPLSQAPANHSISSLSQARNRSASYDSGVHATDDEVFSSGSSSQEDVARLPESSKEQPLQFLRSGKWNALPHTKPDGQFKVDYSSAFSQISSQAEQNHRPYVPYHPGIIACQKEDLQRSDSVDSAYGDSQESTSSQMDQPSGRIPLSHCQYAPLKPFEFNATATLGHSFVTSSSEKFPRPLPRRPGSECQEKTENVALNGVPRPEFLFSSLCKNEDLSGLVSKTKVPNNLNGGPPIAAFTQHRSHLSRTPLPDSSSPSFRRKTSFSSLMADLHDIGADSPTQLQLLGSSLMEGLLGDSPRSSTDPTSESHNGTSSAGRLIRALNLFSPTECLNSPHTPASARKRTVGMLPSPEPSPEAGAYVGQHSQGLGGHYAGPLFGSLNLSKRRRSNET